MSVESVNSADTGGVLQSLRIAFEGIEIKNLDGSVVALYVDGASVNTDRKRGLGMLIKQITTWLALVHRFNYRLKLVLKDDFHNSLFGKTEQFSLKFIPCTIKAKRDTVC